MKEPGILRSDISQETTNVAPTELFPYIVPIISRFGIIVAKEKAMFAVDERASFIVDDFVDAKESSGVGKATAVPEVDGSIFFEHQGVDLI